MDLEFKVIEGQKVLPSLELLEELRELNQRAQLYLELLLKMVDEKIVPIETTEAKLEAIDEEFLKEFSTELFKFVHSIFCVYSRAVKVHDSIARVHNVKARTSALTRITEKERSDKAARELTKGKSTTDVLGAAVDKLSQADRDKLLALLKQRAGLSS